METVNTGSNLTTVRENNLSLVIRLIHRAGICSRADIAKATGLKQATITNIVNDLISWGVVCETGYIAGLGNRRSIGITLSVNRYRTIGVRLNRKYLMAGLFDLTGKLMENEKYDFDSQPHPEEAMHTMSELIHKLLSHTARENILGIGVALPGPFVSKKGKIALMSGFPGWEKIDIKEELESQFSIPVFLEHDANCGALSELWYGNIGAYKDIVFIAADTGVGAGILIDQKLYTGNLGIAGEIGHTSIDYNGPRCECGNRGCLELYCSTEALLQEYKKELLCSSDAVMPEEITADYVLSAVADGDKTARRAFTSISKFLGVGLVSIVNSFDPELIIISDRLARAGDFLITAVDKVLKERLLPQVYDGITLRLGTFAEDGLLFGASALVLENLLKQPTLYFKPQDPLHPFSGCIPEENSASRGRTTV